MFTLSPIRANDGQHYVIVCARKVSANQQSINFADKAINFHNTFSCLSFIKQLHAPFGYWQQLAQQSTRNALKAWQVSHPHQSIEHFIAQALVNGSLVTYKSLSVNQLLQTSHQRQFKNSQGRNYQLLPASAALLNKPNNVQAITSKSAADKILQDLDITDNRAEILVNSLALNDTPNASQTNTATDVLSQALISGEIIVDLAPEQRKPQPGDIVEEVVEAAKPPAAPPPPSSAPPPAQSESKAAEPAGRDDNKSADGLEKASQNGTPFCEECQKDEKAA